MKLGLPSEFVLFDLEWTSWEGFMQSNWQMPGKYREVIQIGALKVGNNLEEKDFLSVFIKPTKNPELSPFIIGLTGITQAQVESGTTLEQAVAEFSLFTGNLPMYSYGDDAEVLKANCELLDMSFPFALEQCNNLRPQMKLVLEERGIDYSAYSSGTLIEAFGKKGGRAHDAVNDMRNLLEVIKAVNYS